MSRHSHPTRIKLNHDEYAPTPTLTRSIKSFGTRTPHLKTNYALPPLKYVNGCIIGRHKERESRGATSAKNMKLKNKNDERATSQRKKNELAVQRLSHSFGAFLYPRTGKWVFISFLFSFFSGVFLCVYRGEGIEHQATTNFTPRKRRSRWQ